MTDNNSGKMRHGGGRYRKRASPIKGVEGFLREDRGRQKAFEGVAFERI